tara:strand:- start:21 stop:377 length:357 start_codon:yes stop_codon:yes gene_type:complete
MVKRTGPTNLELYNLIEDLDRLGSKEKVSLWKRIARDLGKPTRIRRRVNIYKIDKFTKDGEVAVVPGKVLSVGELTKKITVAAYQFSEEAKEKLGDKAITIKELMEKNPKGSKARIIG